MSEWRTKFRVHPLADAWPMMDDDKLAALAADIRAHGLRQPIIYHDEDDEFVVVDGRNRLEAMERHGIKLQLPLINPPNTPFAGRPCSAYFRSLTWPEMQNIPAMIESLNEHRRHMSPEALAERRERARKLIEEHPELSARQIAKQSGVSPPTAAKMRQEHAEKSGVKIDTSLDTRGRQQPAKKAPPLTAKEAFKIVEGRSAEEKTKKVGPPIKATDPVLQQEARAATERRHSGIVRERFIAKQARAAAPVEVRPPVPEIKHEGKPTREQVDPEFDGDGLAFTAKYGHVLVKTAQEWATERYGAWADEFGFVAKKLQRSLIDQPGLPHGVDLNWLRKPRVADTRKLAEAIETLEAMLATAKAMLARAIAAEEYLPAASQSGLAAAKENPPQ